MMVPGLKSMVAALGSRWAPDPLPMREAARPTLRIGVCSSLSRGYLRDLIRSVRGTPAPPAFSFVEGAPAEIVRAVDRGDVDVGFVFGPQNTAGLQSEALWREQLVVLMPGGHPLEGEGALTRNALRNETFLVAGGPSERDLFVALLERTLDGRLRRPRRSGRLATLA